MRALAILAAVFYSGSLVLNLVQGDLRMAFAVFNTLIWVSIVILKGT
jgi:hypothetical protein